MKRRDFIKGVAVYTPGLALPLVAGAGYIQGCGPGSGVVPPCDTMCEVPSPRAGMRETNFANWKLPVLNNLLGSGSENKWIPVDLIHFRDKLKGFANNSSYNGMRVYFAVADQGVNSPTNLPPDQVGKLTVIFVPTIINSNYAKGGDDDPSQCWWLYNKIQYNFPKRDPAHPENDGANRWISNYRAYKVGGPKGLRADGRKNSGNKKFEETNSIWYDMAYIKGQTLSDGTIDCGMIGYINDRLNSTTDQIDSLNVRFGGYDMSENSDSFPYYQLLVQFDFYKQGTDKVFTFGSSNGEEFFRKKGLDIKKFRLAGGTTDTGLPCPPADSCNGTGF